MAANLTSRDVICDFLTFQANNQANILEIFFVSISSKKNRPDAQARDERSGFRAPQLARLKLQLLRHV